MSLNKVMLIGNVGVDPTVRYTPAGICVAQVRLATTERGYTLANGTQVPEQTEWHNLIFWDKQGEVVEKYVHKGDKLYVEGRIQTRQYDDRQGIRRYSTEIMVSAMEMLTPKQTVPGQQPAQQSQPAQTMQQPVQSQSAAGQDTTQPPF